ncbi:hypothetical protein GCM10009557_79530 [Virgisporangium ochraceum]|uniref:ABM domain-containing protein n=1 Tax=Virgisporangium ochraceum TaxID=65505 RepID=A0A8J4A035_9ACTN|nr:putative quinol monooxygenase [Virgisporangium ochraceum]GIJ70506.1 hypothetical protein Voc01_054230 [Virgisporangium ochraceum]
MIIISGFMELDPGDTDEFARLSAALCVASRAEDGCSDYRFARSVEDPARFDIFEVYDTDAALEEHARAGHYRKWRSAVRGLGVRRTHVVRYTVTEGTPA